MPSKVERWLASQAKKQEGTATDKIRADRALDSGSEEFRVGAELDRYVGKASALAPYSPAPTTEQPTYVEQTPLERKEQTLVSAARQRAEKRKTAGDDYYKKEYGMTKAEYDKEYDAIDRMSAVREARSDMQEIEDTAKARTEEKVALAPLVKEYKDAFIGILPESAYAWHSPVGDKEEIKEDIVLDYLMTLPAEERYAQLEKAAYRSTIVPRIEALKEKATQFMNKEAERIIETQKHVPVPSYSAAAGMQLGASGTWESPVEYLEDLYTSVKKDDFKSGFVEAADWRDFISFGLASLGGDAAKLQALQKAHKGEPLTEQDEFFIEVAEIEQALEDFRKEKGGASFLNSLGSGAAHSTQFLAEMAMTGGIGGAAKAATSGVKQAFKQGIRQGLKQLAFKNVPRTIVYGAKRSPLMAGTYRNLMDRRINQYSVANGQVDLTNPESLWKSIGVAWADQTFEIASELWGNMLHLGFGKIGKAIGADKWLKTKSVSFKTTPAMRRIFRDGLLWSGDMPSEMTSEFLGDVATNLAYEAFNEDETYWGELFTRDYWGNLLALTAGLKAGVTVASIPSIVDSNKKVKQLEARSAEAFNAIGNEELKNKVLNLGGRTDIEDVAEYMHSIDWSQYKPIEVAHAIDYMMSEVERQVVAGSEAEQERAERYAPRLERIQELAYRNAEGVAMPTMVTAEANFGVDNTQGVTILEGDYANPEAMVRVRLADGTTDVVLGEKLSNVQETDMSALVAEDYAMTFAEEDAMETLGGVEQTLFDMQRTGASNTQQIRAVEKAGLTVFNEGEVVTLLNGEEATVVEGFRHGLYTVMRADGSLSMVGVGGILQPDVAMAQAQRSAAMPQEQTPLTQSAPLPEDIDTTTDYATPDGFVGKAVDYNAESDQVTLQSADGGLTNVPRASLTAANAEQIAPQEDITENLATETISEMEQGEAEEAPMPVAPQTAPIPQNEDGSVDYESMTDATMYANALESDMGNVADAQEAVADVRQSKEAELAKLQEQKKQTANMNEKVALKQQEQKLVQQIAMLNEVENILGSRATAVEAETAQVNEAVETAPIAEATTEQTAPTTEPTRAIVEGVKDNYLATQLRNENPAEYNTFNALAKLLGLEIEFVESAGEGNALIVGNKMQVAYNPANREETLRFLIGHESLHRMKQVAPEAYAELMEDVKSYIGEDLFGQRVERLRLRYEHQGIAITDESLEEEVVADFIGEMEEDYNVVSDLVTNNPNKSWWQKLIEGLRNLFSFLEESSADTTKVASILNKIETAYKTAAEKVQTLEVETVNGEVSAEINEAEGQAKLSIRTYEEGGRATLVDFLQKQQAKDALTAEEADDILAQMDNLYTICKEYKDKYVPFGQWSDASVVVGEDGKPVFSVIKKNGEYAMNLDFSLVCKKRRTLDAVLNEMVKRGLIEGISVSETTIAKINEVIRRYGFETACALCFVDARRFRVLKVAKDFADLYNSVVDKLIPKGSNIAVNEFNYGGREGVVEKENALDTMADESLNISALQKMSEGKSVKARIAQHLLDKPQDRKYVTPSDFVSTAGFDNVAANNVPLLKLYNAKKGTGGPKAAFSDVQYLNDIARKNWSVEDAFAVGGVRIQSFSDFVPRMVFDYMQMVAELAGKRLPAHAYTKEAIFAKMFGLTGIKINLSLVPDVVEGGVAAGLDANGDYVWRDGETFPYKEAVALQNAEGYKENCGTIAVGVSDEHILKMLDDPHIRMVIPYHKSGLNPLVAKMNNIGAYKDYTKEQSTRTAKGNSRTKEQKAQLPEPSFNELLRESNSPMEAAQKYLDWCKEHNLKPKFDRFASHPNYYKLLEDFTTYVDGAYVPQRSVTMTYPTAEDAFGSISELIAQGLEEDAILEGQRDAKVSQMVDEIEGAKFSLIGEKGASALDAFEESTTRLDNLNVAREMEASGKDAKTIKMATGWERGVDGLWRYEIMDARLKAPDDFLHLRNPKLSDIIENADELFAAYPALKDIKITLGKAQDYSGVYYPSENVIKISTGLLRHYNNKANEYSIFPRDVEINLRNLMQAMAATTSTLVHEIQHAIQHIEGFAEGGNSRMVLNDSKADLQALWQEWSNRAKAYNAKSTDWRLSPEGRAEREALMKEKRKLNSLQRKNSLGASGYHKLAGEVEARNIEARLNMTPEERLASLAEETEDVARKDQIILREGLIEGAKFSLRNPEWQSQFGVPLADGKELSLEDVRTIFERTNKRKVLQQMFDKVYEVMEKLPYYGIIVTSQMPEGSEDSLGVADGKGNILLNVRMFQEISNKGIATTILHEMIHSATTYATIAYEERNENPEAYKALPENIKTACQRLQNIYDFLLKRNNLKEEYGMTSIHEMLAELSNPQFRALLREEGVWEKLVNALKRFFGIGTGKTVKELDETLKTFLENFDRSAYVETVETIAGEKVFERKVDAKEADAYSDVMYSIREKDAKTLDMLNNGETIKVYRAMQVIDGKLYPPMSAKVDGKMREPIELGVWERAEERPDLADAKGYFKLDKGNKSSLKARYNPYIHTSLTPLNDQFSSAQDRPNLVTVEVEIPASELTSGYKAEKAKDAVGKLEWKAGVVQSQLSGTRTVILSRWDRPLRIVPDSEVAQRIVEMFGDKDVVMPSNVVTPSLRAELEKLGVPFKETDNQGKEVKYSLKAYHGSGVEFDNFDHAYMSTGEGQQIFGWGTYITEVPDIASSYANTVSDNNSIKYHKKGLEYRINKAKEDIEFLNKRIAVYANDAEYVLRLIGQQEQLLNVIRQSEQDLLRLNNLDQSRSRVLYEVNIPDNNGDNYITYEERVTEPIKAKVYKALDEFNSVFIEDTRDSLNLKADVSDGDVLELLRSRISLTSGKDMYNDLSAYLGGDKEASLFLADAGIVGISYPAEYTTGGRVDNSRNYVIFNADDAQIVSKEKLSLKSLDAPYLDAVARGDMATAERMVREAAAIAMPNTMVVDKDGLPKVVYHGTSSNDTFNVFDLEDSGMIFMTSSKGIADQYTHKRGSISINPKQTGRIMPLFANIETPLVVDANKRLWRNLRVDWSEAPVSTRDIALYAKENGYDGVIIKRVSDNMFDDDTRYSDVYIAFNPSQVKSAGALYSKTKRSHFPWDEYEKLEGEIGVTYDDAGNIIPLSERFNPEKEDIRFSLRERTDEKLTPAMIRHHMMENVTRHHEQEVNRINRFYDREERQAKALAKKARKEAGLVYPKNGKITDRLAFLIPDGKTTLPMELQVTYDIANGLKLKWSDSKDGRKHGLSSELGLGSSRKEGYGAITVGATMYVEDYVAQLMEENSGYSRDLDDNDIRNAVINVLSQYTKPKQAIQALEDIFLSNEMDDAEAEALYKIDLRRQEALEEENARYEGLKTSYERNPRAFERDYFEQMEKDVVALNFKEREIRRLKRDIKALRNTHNKTYREQAERIQKVREAIDDFLKSTFGRNISTTEVKRLFDALQKATTQKQLERVIEAVSRMEKRTTDRIEQERKRRLLKMKLSFFIPADAISLEEYLKDENQKASDAAAIIDYYNTENSDPVMNTFRIALKDRYKGKDSSGVSVAKLIDAETAEIMAFISTNATRRDIVEANLAEETAKLYEAKEKLKGKLPFSQSTMDKIDQAYEVVLNYWEADIKRQGAVSYNKAMRELSIEIEIAKKKRDEAQLAGSDELYELAVAEVAGLMNEARELAESHYDGMGKANKILMEANDAVERLLLGGRRLLSEEREAKRKHDAEVLRDAINDITNYGEEYKELNEKAHDQRKASKDKEPSRLKRIHSEWADSLEYLLNVMAPYAPEGSGLTYQRIIGGALGAASTLYTNTKVVNMAVEGAIKRIWGGKMKHNTLPKLLNQSQQIVLAENYAIGYYEETEDGKKVKKPRRWCLTMGNAIYLLAMWEQPDSHYKLTANGVTQEVIDDVTSLIANKDARWIEFKNWVVDELLPARREVYDETHRKVQGTYMAESKNYFPIHILSQDRHQEEKASEEKAQQRSIKPSGIKQRVYNTNMIDLNVDFVKALMDNLYTMEMWAAIAPVEEDMNVILSNNTAKNLMNAKFGADFSQRLKTAMQVTVGTLTSGYISSTEKFFQDLTRRWGGTKIAFGINTALKQLAGAGAMCVYTADLRFLWYLAKNIQFLFTPKSAQEFFPMLQKRWEEGLAGNIGLKELFRSDVTTSSGFDIATENVNRVTTDIVKLGMIPNKIVDMAVCAMMAKSVYEYEYNRYIKQGYSKEMAEKKAMIDAESSYNKTQQSSEMAFLSSGQVSSNILNRSLNIFMNNSIANYRIGVMGIEDIKKGLFRFKKAQRNMRKATERRLFEQYTASGMAEEEARAKAQQEADIITSKLSRSSFVAKGIFRSLWGFYFANIVFGFMGIAPYLLFGDDDDKKEELIIELMKSSIWTPLTLIPTTKAIYETFAYAWKSSKEGRGYQVSIAESLFPMLEDVDQLITNSVGAVADIADGGDMSYAQIYNTFDALLRMGVGVDTNRMFAITDGFIDLGNGDWLEGTLDVLSVPKSQIKLLTGDRKDGETAKEYMTRVMRTMSIVDKNKIDVAELENYNFELGKWEKPTNISAAEKRKVSELYNQYQAEYKKDMLKRCSEEVRTNYPEVVEKHAEILKDMGVQDTKLALVRYYEQMVDTLTPEVASALERLAVLQAEISATEKSLDLMVSQDGKEYIDLLTEEFNLRKAFVAQYEIYENLTK